MKCPSCNGEHMRTYKSVPCVHGRRQSRKCTDCGARLHTIEIEREAYDHLVQAATVGNRIRKRVARFEEQIVVLRRRANIRGAEILRLRKRLDDPQGHVTTMHRQKLRREARIEAKATGIPVEQIYEQWGVA